jgi:hypothetical protein
MQSTVEVEIKRSQHEVAELFADPHNNPKWMLDLKRYEPVSGKQGMVGSTYRLVPKDGNMTFLVTAIARNLPDELKLHLEAPDVDVAVTGTLIDLSPTRTRLISKEVFTFKGSEDDAVGIDVKNAIKAQHRRHIEDFKRFAEGQLPAA